MKRVIQSDQAPAPIGAYSQAIQCNNGFLYLSGQIGLKTGDDRLVSSNTIEQLAQICHNIESVLAAASMTLENVIKLTIFMTDIREFNQVNKYLQQTLPQPFPARSLIQAAKLPKDATIEVEAIAYNAA